MVKTLFWSDYGEPKNDRNLNFTYVILSKSMNVMRDFWVPNSYLNIATKRILSVLLNILSERAR